MRLIFLLAAALSTTAAIAAPPKKPAQKNTNSPALCYKDYCPCEEASPTDEMICRHLRRGGRMDLDVMRNGAILRDANRAMQAYSPGS